MTYKASSSPTTFTEVTTLNPDSLINADANPFFYALEQAKVQTIEFYAQATDNASPANTYIWS